MINCESKQLFNIQVWGSEDDKQKDGLSLAIFAKLLSNWLIQLCWWDCKTDGRNRWAKQMGEMPTFTGAQAARQKHNFHTELFWGVIQGFPQHQKPFHTDHTPQVCQTKYFEVTIQVKHLCPLPHSLLSHLLVQGRAHILGTPLSPPTIGDQ